MVCDIGAANLNLGECFLLNDSKKVSDVYNTPTVIVNMAVRLLFIAGGLLLFFLILYSGFLFITGNVKGKDKAQEVLSTAVIGFIVMFCAYWIIQIIKLVTGANINI